MNRRILIIISCALVLSLCASYLVWKAVGNKGTTAQAVRTTPVVVAVRDLEAGALIRDSDIKIAAWTGPVPKGALAKSDGIVSRGVAAPIYDGEPITESRLTAQGSGGGLAGIIPSGMRACAVRVNDVVGVAGFVVPGMRVDVLITGLPPGADPASGSRVRTLLQNIQVLSAGTDFQHDQTGKPQPAQVVNLLVTPADAEVLSLASNEMHIQLVLRNPMDTAIAKPPGTVVSDLFGGEHAVASPVRTVAIADRMKDAVDPQPRPAPAPVPVAAAPAPVKPYVIEVENGATHTEARFNPAEVHE